MNADTLTNKMAELILLVREHSPDIIGINEVLPKNFNRHIYVEEFAMDGYEMVAHESISDNRGRGTILYIRKGINYKQIDVQYNDEKFQESVYVEISLADNDTLLCACMYRRGETDEKNNDTLRNILLELSSKQYSHLLVMGDFNFNGINWEEISCPDQDLSSLNHLFIECIRDCFFFQHVTEPTRQRGTDNPSTLDLIFTNEENMIENLVYEAPLGKSDHSVLKFTFICQIQSAPPTFKVQYEKGNYKKMNEILSGVDWNTEFSQYPNDVEKQWSFFINKYQEIQQIYVPRKVVLVNGKIKKKFSIPLDRKNLRNIKKKNRLWNKIRKDLASAEEKLQFNRLRNNIRRLTRKGKKLLEQTIAKNTKSNPKVFWKYTQSKLKSRSNIPDIMEPGTENDPKYAKCDTDKAKVFLDYFSSVFTTESDQNNLPFFEKRNYETVINDINITEEQIVKKLKKLKVNKSPGPDSVHPRVINELAETLSVPLVIIYNTSIRTKTLPMDWKHANVSVIFKKGSKTTPKNYRPVSLTSILCKTLESIVRDSIIEHMEKNNLFSKKQFGFITGRSTVLQLLHVLNIWIEILDQGGDLEVVYCDFMKAFDKVPHRRLIHKIEKYGITGNVLGWIESFLSDRTHCVVINNTKSHCAAVTSGIPQGSVLGPILFVIYINDLPEVVNKNSYVYFLLTTLKSFVR